MTQDTGAPPISNHSSLLIKLYGPRTVPHELRLTKKTNKKPRGVEGLSKKEKGLMDVNNSVVIAGERECKGTKW